MRLRPGRVFKYKKSLITILVVAVAVALTLLVVKNLKAPAQGSLSQAPLSKAEVVVPYSHPGTYKGQYVIFTYPEHFKVEPSKLTGSYLETVALGNTDLSGVQINVGVWRGQINDDGSVSYRRQHPELYRSNTSSKYIEFIKLDGTEDTFFIQHGDLIASVSASAPNVNLSDQASYVASGLKWR